MKKEKIILIFLLLTIPLISKAQIAFKEGYYINNSNKKIDGYIEDVGWFNNPKQFVFKETLTDNEKILKIDSVQEFGIKNIFKYVRFNLDIDKSSNSKDFLSKSKNPKYEKETLFLKTIVDGNASLFVFSDKKIKKFFFKTSNNKIEQLVFKEYINQNGKIGVNNGFKNQLLQKLKCERINFKSLKETDYNEKDLTNLFVTYNKCKGEDPTTYNKNKNSNSFNVSAKLGTNSSTLSINDGGLLAKETNYNREFDLRFGVEFEFILKFNKNKWALIIEPTYLSYDAEEIGSLGDGIKTTATYKAIELPLGIRHYLFLNDKSKLFVNSSMIYDFVFEGSTARSLKASPSINFSIGLGYNYKKKYSLELRHYTRRNILASYLSLAANYQTTSLIFGYTFF
jgi:hypothetical protein